MNVSIGSDHAGFAFKEALREMLEADGHVVIDVGTRSEDSANYPEFGVAAARLVASGDAQYGVIICGSGIGISIAANKVAGIRAANCTTVAMAELARQHNDANMVALGSRIVPLDLAKEIVRVFLATSFEGGRHAVRVGQIHTLGDIQ